jgi:lipopolysaccharide transport system ATP-binding protein
MPIIRVENLSKRYRIGERARFITLRDVLARAASAPVRVFRGPKPASSGGESTHIWALKDVSFEIRQGEVVGIIGRNGAGKTTLLKILARVAFPTQGFADVRGRMGSLLEVGTGFHPELTGRENVFLSGAILGMRKAEIDRKFDEIVAFSQVEKFIDTPLKHYSSGMQTRLAFAVAAHLEPEILLVDEVLAVGDAAFQRKCLGKMGEIAREGRTILFVSHNLGALTRLCPRAIWLEAGEVLRDGDSVKLAAEYFGRQSTTTADWRRAAPARHDSALHFLEARLFGSDGEATRVFSGREPVTVEIHYEVRRPLAGCQVVARITSAEGLIVFTTSDSDTSEADRWREAGAYTSRFNIPAALLAPGVYSLTLGAHLPNQQVYDLVEHVVAFEVLPIDRVSSRDRRLGVITPNLAWDTCCRQSIAAPAGMNEMAVLSAALDPQ